LLLSGRFWFGTAVSLALIFLFLWKIDFGQTWNVLRDADYVYFIPAVLLYFVALGFRAIRWRYLLLHLKAIPPWRLYPVVAIGYLANNVLPVRLGEVVRAHSLGEREQVSRASALATIAVERVMDGLTLIFFAAVIWPFLPWTDVLKIDDGGLNAIWVVLSVLVALVFVVGFLVLLLLAASPEMGRRLASLVTSFLPAGLRPKAERMIYLLIEGLGSLRNPRMLLVISAVSLPVWLAEAAMYYILSLSFDLDQPFQVILLVTVTSNLATAVPSSIGGIGPFEVVAKSTLVAFGVTGEPAAAYAFFVHIVALWLPVNLLGLIFLSRENLSLRRLVKGSSMDLSTGAQTPAGAVVEYDVRYRTEDGAPGEVEAE